MRTFLLLPIFLAAHVFAADHEAVPNVPSSEPTADDLARLQERLRGLVEKMQSGKSLGVHWKLMISVPPDGKEPNVLIGSLLNVSAESQMLHVWEPAAGWIIKVTSNGQPIPMKQLPPITARDGKVRSIQPGQASEQRFDLNELFDLIPGEAYEVSVSCYLGWTATDIPEREKHRYTVHAVPLAFVARR